MRVRQRLRERGVTWRIPYKTDEATLAGQYAGNTKRRVSLYYL